MMGKAQFYVSAELMACALVTPIDMPWPEGTRVLAEVWDRLHNRLHVTIEHVDIPDSDQDSLWCVPSFYRKEAGEAAFEAWNFREDW